MSHLLLDNKFLSWLRHYGGIPLVQFINGQGGTTHSKIVSFPHSISCQVLSRQLILRLKVPRRKQIDWVAGMQCRLQAIPLGLLLLKQVAIVTLTIGSAFQSFKTVLECNIARIQQLLWCLILSLDRVL